MEGQEFHVLACEDDFVSGLLLQEIARLNNWALDLVQKGESAIKQITLRDYDALILDIRLPDQSGYEVSRKIRKKSITIPIIAVTAYVSKDAEEMCLSSGINYFIPKPFNIDDFVERIEGVFQRA